MPLTAQDLADDLNSEFNSSFPAAVQPDMESYHLALATAITNHIKRAVVDDVTVNTSTGAQSNTSSVK